MKYSFFPAYSLGLLIFIIASLRGSDLKKIQQFHDNALIRFLLSDPFMHFLTFGILIFLICFGYRRSTDSASRKVLPPQFCISKTRRGGYKKDLDYGTGSEKEKSVTSNLPYYKAGLIGVGYSIFIEVYQGILPWRSFGLDDLLWDMMGVAFAILILKKWGQSRFYDSAPLRP